MRSQRSPQFLKNFVFLEPGYSLPRYVDRGPPWQIENPPHENALNFGVVGISGSFEGLGGGACTTGGPFGIVVTGAISSSGGAVTASLGRFGSAGPGP